MKNLFDVLDSIVSSDYKENLDSVDSIIVVAEAGNMVIISDMAEAIQEVGKSWLQQQVSGNGEWSKMRDEAKKQLVCYMCTSIQVMWLVVLSGKMTMIVWMPSLGSAYL